MAKFRHRDYTVLVEIVMNARNHSGSYIEAPPYISFPETGPMEAEEIAEYFDLTYVKHKSDNPDFSSMLEEAVDLFIRNTSIISFSPADEVALNRGLQLFKQKYQVTNQESEESDSRNVKGGLTHKQQILLLEKLGILQNPLFDQLNVKNKALLISKILRRDPDNTEKYLANLRAPVKRPISKLVVRDTDEIAVNKLLNDLGVNK